MALIRALNAGISGLRSQSTKIDVVGDNIANSTTTGFKRSRVDFQTIFSQTLSFGTRPQGNLGGINPVQVGLGAQVGAIQRDHTQGSLDATGIATDMAIEGDGFFILEDESGSQVYSRDGTFSINPSNLLHDPSTGFIVQGVQADFDTFQIPVGGPIDGLEIPVGTLSIARETDVGFFDGNLNTGGDLATEGTVLESETFFDITTGLAADENTDLTDLARANPAGGLFDLDLNIGDEIQLAADKGGRAITETFTVGDPPPSGGTTFGELAQWIQGGLAINENNAADSAMHSASVNNGTFDGASTFTDAGGGFFELSDPSNDFSGVEEGDFIRWGTGTAAGDILEITEIRDDDADGTPEVIRFGETGATMSGTPVVGDLYFIHEPAEVTIGENEADYVGDYPGGVGASSGAGDADSAETDPFPPVAGSTTPTPVEATERSAAGRLRIAGNVGAANSITNFELTSDNSRLGVFSELNEAAGESARVNATFYDSLGRPRVVQMTFQFESSSNSGTVWRWLAESQDNDPNFGLPLDRTVGTGTITFDTNGQFVSSSPDQVSISLNSTGATTPLIVNPDFSELTGFAADVAVDGTLTNDTEVALVDQDGFEEGTLRDFAVGATGVITGIFDNGLTRDLGQVLLARFANNQGLRGEGDNMFRQGTNSGLPLIGTPGSFARGTIRSGFLEESNVDLAKEFTDLIVGQRAFQANARTITTSDEMLQELVNLV